MPEESTPARQIVEAEIRAKGPISFARFMEIALYEEHGYYTSSMKAGADYATSPQMHPAFGALIAGYLFKAWKALGEPETFDVVEIGASDGGLAQDILDAIARPRTETVSRFASAIEYGAFDVRPRSSVRSNDELTGLHGITGCVISNELLDAFPTHIFTVRDREVLECFVDVDPNDHLVFVEGEVSNAEISDRMDGIAAIFPEGYHGEVNLGIMDWASTVSRILERGYVLTIDYGHEREMLYHPSRSEGSLRCYRKHALGQNPFRDVGLQDITAHVDFTTVDQALRRFGFDKTSTLGTQREFLLDLGFGAYIREVRREAAGAASANHARRMTAEMRGLNALVDVRGLGAFKVAQYALDAPQINLEGLETSPAFQLPRPQSHHLSSLPYD